MFTVESTPPRARRPDHRVRTKSVVWKMRTGIGVPPESSVMSPRILKIAPLICRVRIDGAPSLARVRATRFALRADGSEGLGHGFMTAGTLGGGDDHNSHGRVAGAEAGKNLTSVSELRSG